jgi:hypothetical protein
MRTIPSSAADTLVIEKQSTTTPVEKVRLPFNRCRDRLIDQGVGPTMSRNISQENTFMRMKIYHPFIGEKVMKSCFYCTKVAGESTMGKADCRPKLFIYIILRR